MGKYCFHRCLFTPGGVPQGTPMSGDGVPPTPVKRFGVSPLGWMRVPPLPVQRLWGTHIRLDGVTLSPSGWMGWMHPILGDRAAQQVLSMWWVVCLMHSHRWTFLFANVFKAWLPCWHLFSMQVLHQKWICGSHRWESTQGIQSDFETQGKCHQKYKTGIISNIKVTKIVSNNILWTFWRFLRLITFDLKIDPIDLELHHVKFFFINLRHSLGVWYFDNSCEQFSNNRNSMCSLNIQEPHRNYMETKWEWQEPHGNDGNNVNVGRGRKDTCHQVYLVWFS